MSEVRSLLKLPTSFTVKQAFKVVLLTAQPISKSGHSLEIVYKLKKIQN